MRTQSPAVRAHPGSMGVHEHLVAIAKPEHHRRHGSHLQRGEEHREAVPAPREAPGLKHACREHTRACSVLGCQAIQQRHGRGSSSSIGRLLSIMALALTALLRQHQEVRQDSMNHIPVYGKKEVSSHLAGSGRRCMCCGCSCLRWLQPLRPCSTAKLPVTCRERAPCACMTGTGTDACTGRQCEGNSRKLQGTASGVLKDRGGWHGARAARAGAPAEDEDGQPDGSAHARDGHLARDLHDAVPACAPCLAHAPTCEMEQAAQPAGADPM